ncbi:predicted protein [Postia placenta Mad-698-R]|nr:predicted protein [Postia placenta Mad-698-R]
MTPPPTNESVVFCNNRGCTVWKSRGIQLKRCQGCKIKRYCRWADRNRTPCYNGLLAALDLPNRPQAQQETLLMVELGYSPGAQHLSDRFSTTKVMVTRWQKLEESEDAWIRQNLAKLAIKRAQLEAEVMSLPQWIVYGVGIVVLIVHFADPTARAGYMFLDLPYRIQNLDLLSRPVFSRTGWPYELIEELDGTGKGRRHVS